MKSSILVYGLAAGDTERWREQLLASSCQSPADVEKVKAAAARDGFHSFRTAQFNPDQAPDFTRVFA